jgi:hypothetical protein
VARFPVYTDADVHGPIVTGLIDRGWDVLRAVDAKPEGTDDIDHFELAVSLSRVMIANDKHMKATAEGWIQEGRSFPGLIWWPRKAYAAMSNSEILDAEQRSLSTDEMPSAGTGGSLSISIAPFRMTRSSSGSGKSWRA